MTKQDKAEAANKPENDVDGEEDYSSSDEEDEDLVLEGVIKRNPEVSDSDDTSSEEEDEEDDEPQKEEDSKQPPRKKVKTGASSDKVVNISKSATKKKKKPKKKEAGTEIVQVDFTFCDMEERFFSGLKTLLTATSPAYAAHSSPLSDLMIENVSVGTVTSTEGDVDGTVYGFASVLNVTTFQDKPCIQALKKLCIEKCPDANKKELEIVLSGKTKRPAGFYLHGRMVNMPLEIVQVLHEQLIMDMDWAVKNAHGGEEQRKSLDFGAFVRIAPTYRTSGVSYYKLFDDEIFSTHAEFSYEIELPRTFGMEETPYCMVMVLTKTGHRAAMKSLVEMIAGGAGRS